jgi:hypothetical protein
MEMAERERPRRLRWLTAAFVVVGAFAAPAVAQAANSWAVVNSAGTLVRGAGVTSAAHLSTGTYQVTFSKSQTGCGYVATPGDTGAGAVTGPIEATVASRSGNAQALFIQTFDQSTGGLSDQPFHVETYCGRNRFAVVDSTGALARGNHVVSASHLGAGSYEVIFDSNVNKCSFQAAIGTTGTGAVVNPGLITVAGRAGNTAGVFVRIVDRSGNALDSSFHLAVNCGAKKLIGVIESTGAKVRGSHVVSSTKLSGANGGTYEVIFDQNVSACAYTATVGVTGNGGSIGPPPVTITTATRAGNPNGVFVFIHQADGSTIDEPFHLNVICGATVLTTATTAAPSAGGSLQNAPSDRPSPLRGGASADPLNGQVGAAVTGDAPDDEDG